MIDGTLKYDIGGNTFRKNLFHLKTKCLPTVDSDDFSKLYFDEKLTLFAYYLLLNPSQNIRHLTEKLF